MAAKQLNDRNKSDRKNKKSPTRRRITTSARRRRHELIGTAMNRTKATIDAGKRAFRNGAEGTNGRKVAPAKSMRRLVFRQPKTELEQAIQRYIDLFDFTGRKRAEQALRDRQQRLQATYERAPIGISEASPEGKYVGVNEEFCRILEYTKDEILRCRIKDLTHKEDYPREITLYRQLV